MKEIACDNQITDEIRLLLDEFVDGVMCSSACPCEATKYAEGQWDSIGADVLLEFGRQPRLETAPDLVAMVNDEDVINIEDLSEAVQAVLLARGYETPPIVENYIECFDNIVDSDEYESGVSEGLQTFFREFRSRGGFEFIRDIEIEYNCGGICYQPLFYLAGDISRGRP